MGFLDKFRGEKKEPAVMPARIPSIEYAGLEDWIAGQKKELASGLSEEAKPLLEKLPKTLDEIESANRELAEETVKKDVEGRIVSIVTGSRDNYVKSVQRELDGIRSVPGSNPLKIYKQMTASLTALNDTNQRYGQRAYFGFEKRMNDLKKKLNSLVELSKEMDGIVAKEKERLAALEKGSAGLEGLKELEEALDGKRRRLRELRARLDEEASIAEETAGKLKEVEGSEKASDFTRLRSELATLDSEVRTVETRILNAIGPLKRVFKKYQKAAETGKYPPGNVAAYIADPTGTFLKGDERLGDLLKNLRKAIEDDGLGLDKNESEKSLRRLDGIGLEALEKLRKEHKAFLEARAELERKLAHLDVTKEVKEFKRVLGGVEERLKDTKSAGEHLEKEIEALENDLEKGLSDIEKTLDIKIIRPPAS